MGTRLITNQLMYGRIKTMIAGGVARIGVKPLAVITALGVGAAAHEIHRDATVPTEWSSKHSDALNTNELINKMRKGGHTAVLAIQCKEGVAIDQATPTLNKGNAQDLTPIALHHTVAPTDEISFENREAHCFVDRALDTVGLRETHHGTGWAPIAVTFGEGDETSVTYVESPYNELCPPPSSDYNGKNDGYYYAFIKNKFQKTPQLKRYF